MTMNNDFINTYIEVALNNSHVLMNENIQLKTNLRIAEALVQKFQENMNNVDGSNQHLLESIDKTSAALAAKEQEVSGLNNRIDNLMKEVVALRNKSSQVDTFAAQISSMKKELEEARKVPEIVLPELTEPTNPKKKKSIDKDDF
tara:strand:+ start:1830 stop:2264 length:435 start_codon:yes stop_codon:yes gene_type:complete